MTTIQSIFDPDKAGRPMRVAAFMSGSGTNIRKLIEHEKNLQKTEGRSPFEVVFIFSDRADGRCQGETIAREYCLPYFSYDIRSFYKKRSLTLTVRTKEGMEARKEFDQIPKKLIAAFGTDINVLGGYMSYTTIKRCVNVHPADLSILTPDGRRKYIGDNAVLDAIAAGEQYLYASTIWTDEGIDTGPLLMVSQAMKVVLPEDLNILLGNRAKFLEVVKMHQERLKEIGDWKILPLTVEMIARGRFALDNKGQVYVDGKPVLRGYRPDFSPS